MAGNTVAVNFSMNRDLYNDYKRLVVSSGDNVKGNLISYMKTVVRYGIPNAETLDAIAESDEIRSDPDRKTYGSFEDILREIEGEL